MPSQEFVNMVIDSGVAAADCGWCGRTHFASGCRNNFDAGELEALQVKAEGDPDQYIEHGDCDSISLGVFAGRCFIAGCCEERWDAAEDLLVSNHHRIIQFYKDRAERLSQEADTLRAAS